MTSTLTTVFATCLLCAAAHAAPPKEAEVQGFYTGTAGGRDAAVRVVALGDGRYRVLVRSTDGDTIETVEMTGRTAGDAVTFTGIGDDREWTAAYAGDGAIAGTCGTAGVLKLQRAERESPTLGKQPPAGAVVLLDGKNFEEMVRSNGANWYVGDMSRDGWAVWEVPVRTIAEKNPETWPAEGTPVPDGWTLAAKDRRRVDTVLGIGEDGSVQVPRGGMRSRRRFAGGFDLHVEFMNNFRPKQRSQGRGNSGCYLPCGTEVQVLDSFGITTYTGGGCGGLYKWKDPDTMGGIPSLAGKKDHTYNLSSRPPLTWQTYDIEYRVRGDEDKKTGYLTVYHNGIKIHDNVTLRKKPREGHFSFQDHGNPVRYRNIWVVPDK